MERSSVNFDFFLIRQRCHELQPRYQEALKAICAMFQFTKKFH